MANFMGRANIHGLPGRFTTATGLKTGRTGRVNTFWQAEVFTKETGKITLCMAMGNIHGPTDVSIMVSGLKI